MTSGKPAKAELCNGAVCYILVQYHYHITLTLSACCLLHAVDDDVYGVSFIRCSDSAIGVRDDGRSDNLITLSLIVHRVPEEDNCLSRKPHQHLHSLERHLNISGRISTSVVVTNRDSQTTFIESFW